LDQRFGEICAYVFRRQLEIDPTGGDLLVAIRPMHAFISAERAMAAGRKLSTELERRHMAGRMAITFIDEITRGPDAPLPPDVSRRSINAMACYAGGPEAGEAYVKTWAFRPSKPVIHLCAAFAWVCLPLRLAENATPIVDLMIQDQNLLRAFVLYAQTLEGPVLASTKLKIAPEQLVRIRWADQVQEDLVA
jgi:hypothetical protein